MSKVNKVIGYAAGFIFVLLGSVIAFNILAMPNVPDNLRIGVGIVLLLYGVLRLLLLKYNKRKSYGNDN